MVGNFMSWPQHIMLSEAHETSSLDLWALCSVFTTKTFQSWLVLKGDNYSRSLSGSGVHEPKFVNQDDNRVS